MEKIIIYHNPRWGKSRNSVGILDEKGIEYEVVKYLELPPSAEKLKEIAKKLDLKPKDFIRKGEKDYAALNLYSKLDDDNALFEAMSKFPKIIERPIVINGEKAIIGRPPEKILEIL